MNKVLHRLLVVLIVGVVAAGFLGPPRRAEGTAHGEAKGTSGLSGGTETTAENFVKASTPTAADLAAAQQTQAYIDAEGTWENQSCNGSCPDCPSVHQQAVRPKESP